MPCPLLYPAPLPSRLTLPERPQGGSGKGDRGQMPSVPGNQARLLCLLLPLLLSAAAGEASPKTAAPRAGGFDDAIADSAADFSGVQGKSSWTYGYRRAWPEFCALARGKGVWRHEGVRITRDTLAATPGLTGIRRWRPSRTGSVRLVGTLQKVSGDAICRVSVNGQDRWTRELAAGDTIPHAFDILLYDVPQGKSVDMAVSGGSVTWRAQILSEPCTAWRPGLPLGPRFSEVQKAAQRESGKRLLAQITLASLDKKGTITLPSGDYRFPGDGSAVLRDLKHLTIDAPGVTFWFDAPQIHGLAFDGCRQVTVRGLTLDCDPLPFFQGRITAINASAGTVTAALMPGYAPSEDHGHRTVSYYRPDGSYIRNGILGCQWSRRPGTALVDIQAPAPGVEVGDYLACVIRTGQALRSLNCGGMVYEDVNIYAGGGMAVFEADGPGGSLYRRVRCTRRPGTNRLHAFGADGFHFNAVGKGPVLDRCEGAYFADDEVNLHGKFGQIGRRLAPNQYQMTTGSAAPFHVGQRLTFWDFVTVEPLGEARVVAVAPGGQSGYVPLTLDGAPDLPVQTLIDTHAQDTRGFVVKNCWFHDTGQRFLLNGAPDGTIKNNTFQNIGGGVDIHEESWAGYTEGAFPSGTVFEGNRLIDMASGVGITLQPAGGHYIRRSMPTKDVKVLDNYFENAGTITADQVDGLVVAGNIFDRPFVDIGPSGFGLIDSDYGDVVDAPIFLAAVARAQVFGNSVYDPRDHTGGRLVRTGPLTRDITVNGTRLWDTIADTVSSWRPDPIQGGRGWSYGTVPAEALHGNAYRMDLFAPLPVNADGWRPGPGRFPIIQRTSMHPSTDRAAVKRWVSTVSGPVEIDGVMQAPGPAGNGTRGCVFLDGKEVWRQDAADHQPHRFHIALRGVKVGAIMDFVVDSQGDMNSDNTLFYAKILTPPRRGGTP